MSKTVFILGAGASVESGVPMMNRFLEISEFLMRTNQHLLFKDEFQLALKARSHLMETHSKATSIDIHNMEAVLSAFEMTSMLGKLGRMNAEEVQRLPAVFRNVIAQTIECTQEFPTNGEQIVPPKPYGDFAKTIKPYNNDVSIITFNYDVGIDHALNFHNIPFSYGLDEADTKGKLALLKLHGSLNWGESEANESIHPVPIEAFFTGHGVRATNSSKTFFVSISNRAEQAGENRIKTNSAPIIIPPTINKTAYNSKLKNVWRNSAKALSEAEKIIVVGYSLPETDQFFRYLYALGTVGPSIIRKFAVIDPDEHVHQKFKALLGKVVFDRFVAHRMKFSSSLGEIDTILKAY